MGFLPSFNWVHVFEVNTSKVCRIWCFLCGLTLSHGSVTKELQIKSHINNIVDGSLSHEVNICIIPLWKEFKVDWFRF